VNVRIQNETSHGSSHRDYTIVNSNLVTVTID